MKIGIIDFIVSIITTIFVTMKYCNYVTWSWKWVLSPVWIYFLFIILIFAIKGIIDYNNEQDDKS